MPNLSQKDEADLVSSRPVHRQPCQGGFLELYEVQVEDSAYFMEPVESLTPVCRLLFMLHAIYHTEWAPFTGQRMDLSGCVPKEMYEEEMGKQRWVPFLAVFCSEDEGSFSRSPAGFAYISYSSREGRVVYEMAEFFVHPTYRNSGLAALFATTLFRLHPGSWIVRIFNPYDPHSLAGEKDQWFLQRAKRFWSKVISASDVNYSFFEKGEAYNTFNVSVGQFSLNIH